MTRFAGSELRKRGQQKIQNIREACQSPGAFVKAIETRETAYGHTEARSIWKNEDLDLTPPPSWTWAWYDFGAFWWSYGFSPGVWAVGSSMIAIGLTYWQAIICVFISHLLGAIGIALHSRTAAKWHMGFPVECRISWGIYASFFPVLVRLLVGLIWCAVNSLKAAYFLDVLFRCIFGHKWSDLTNTIPKSEGITSKQLATYFIFMIVTCPLLSIPVTKIRRVFMVKSFLLPPVVISVFAYCLVQGKNAPGPGGAFPSTEHFTGSTLAWAMLSAINDCMGKTSTQVVNQTDLARYARTKTAPFWSQLIALPVGNTLCSTLGIFATSSVYRAWGVVIWNPWTLCDEILDRNWSAGMRTWIAIVSMCYMFSSTASNIGVNVIPFGMDVTAFLPRFLNIRRGMYLCYFLSMVVFPWKILQTSKTFLRFLGGYSVFLAPLAGIFITDYYVVRKGNIWAKDLYDPRPGAAYYYHKGVSWRCVVAFTVTVVFLVPGFATQFGQDVGVGWEHLYSVGWLFGCTFSSVLYWSLCQFNGFAKTDRLLKWEEAYEIQGMFLENPIDGVAVESKVPDQWTAEEKTATQISSEVTESR